MSTRLFAIVIDSNDHIAQARWWSDVLAVPVTGERDNEAWISIPDAPELIFVPVPEPKTTKNRIHLDLGSASDEDQETTVQRLMDSGARSIDIGQRDVPWVVLADPEGNEFCVLDPRDKYSPRRWASVVVECAAPRDLAMFWIAATDYVLDETGTNAIGLERVGSSAPFLEFVRSDATKRGKNRIHLDVAPSAGGDHALAVERLVKRGARRIDVGQGDAPWAVLADPEDNEFCVLTPR